MRSPSYKTTAQKNISADQILGAFCDYWYAPLDHISLPHAIFGPMWYSLKRILECDFTKGRYLNKMKEDEMAAVDWTGWAWNVPYKLWLKHPNNFHQGTIYSCTLNSLWNKESWAQAEFTRE